MNQQKLQKKKNRRKDYLKKKNILKNFKRQQENRMRRGEKPKGLPIKFPIKRKNEPK